jgi:hypothetical protein
MIYAAERPKNPSASVAAKPDPAWLVLGSEVVLATIFSAIGVFGLVTLAVGAVGAGYGPGALVGAFCAFCAFCALWGGPGFGVMVACALHATREAAAETATEHATETVGAYQPGGVIRRTEATTRSERVDGTLLLRSVTAPARG